MRKIFYLFFLSTACLSACSTNYAPATPPGNSLVASPAAAAATYNPDPVKIYNVGQEPDCNFKIIGIVETSKKNEFGFMKQPAVTKEDLSKEATTMNGDAIILLQDDQGATCKAEVIKFTPVQANAVSSTTPVATTQTQQKT